MKAKSKPNYRFMLKKLVPYIPTFLTLAISIGWIGYGIFHIVTEATTTTQDEQSLIHFVESQDADITVEYIEQVVSNNKIEFQKGEEVLIDGEPFTKIESLEGVVYRVSTRHQSDSNPKNLVTDTDTYYFISQEDLDSKNYNWSLYEYTDH